MAYSNTRLSHFRRCRLRYYWLYLAKDAEHRVGVPLKRGKAGHVALANYYLGAGRDRAIASAWEEFLPTYPDSLEDMEKLDGVLDRYFDWSYLHDRWMVLDVEKTVQAKYKGYDLMGIWDMLVERDGVKWIVDHKFNRSYTTKHLEMDSQMSFYLALAKLAHIEVRGVIYNIINLDAGSKRPAAMRTIVNRTPEFLEAYLEGLIPTIQEIRMMDAGSLPVYANHTHDCSWDCGLYRRCLEYPGLRAKDWIEG